MKIDNLSVGIIVKNYKEMCKILDEPIKAGKGKSLQLERWKRAFTYERNGHEYIVTDIKDGEVSIEPNGGNNKYAKYIESIIINMLKNLDEYRDEEISFTVSTLAKSTCMINDNYYIGRNYMKRLSNYLKIPYETIKDFYEKTYSKMKSIINGTVNRLSKDSIITYTYGFSVVTSSNEYRRANEEEMLQIVLSEEKILDELGVDNRRDLYIKGMYDVFKKRVLEDLDGIKNYYNEYKVRKGHNFSIYELNSEIIKKSSQDINENFYNSSIESAEKVHKKYRRMDYIQYDSQKNICRDKYVEEIQQLSDLCIRSHPSIDLQKELEKVKSKKYSYSDAVYKELDDGIKLILESL